MKKCRTCKESKPLTEFHSHASCAQGVRPDCKECFNVGEAERSVRYRRLNPDKRRSTILKNRFGIDKDEFDAMLASQNGACKICLGVSPGASKKHFSVDHDHKTGKIRGILCHGCNAGLGMFQDNPEALIAASNYLKEHK